MTQERQEQVLDFGFEVMRHMRAPTIALWLAEDGWEGGTILAAERLDGKNVKVTLQVWPSLTIVPSAHNN